MLIFKQIIFCFNKHIYYISSPQYLISEMHGFPVFVLLTTLTTISFCYLRELTYIQVQLFATNPTYSFPYDVSVSYNGNRIALVNVTAWPIFYRLNPATGFYEDDTIDTGQPVSELKFARNSSNYAALMPVFQHSIIRGFERRRNISRSMNLGIGNNDQTILYFEYSGSSGLYGYLVETKYGSIQLSFQYDCSYCGIIRMVLSGRSTNKAVILRQYGGLQIVTLFQYWGRNIETFQILAFHYKVNNEKYWMAVDFSYNETFVAASIRSYTFTIWMIKRTGKYAWLQTQNLTDGINNMTIKKLHFTNDEQKLFVATDKQARIYTKRDVSDTRQTFKLSCTIGLSPNSTSDISADGTTVAALSNTSLRIFKVDVDLIMSQIDPTLYAVLFYGLIPVGVILSIFIIAYVFLKHWQNIRNFCRLLGVILRRNPNRQNKYRQESQRVINVAGQ